LGRRDRVEWSQRLIPIRYRIVGLITLGTMLNYVDRINISVAATEIMRDTGWDEARFGWVFSTFLIGYALFQSPGGALADRWSARKVIGLSCIGFSIFTALTPLGQSAFFLLLVLRFMVGACESLSFPSFASLNSRWIPRSEFARAQAMLLSGVFLGQIVAYPSTAWLVENFSWQVVFYVNAAVGVIWVSAWLWYARDQPRQHPSISEAEISRIESDVVAKDPDASVSLLAILRCRPVIVLCLSYMLYGFIAWLFVFWFPTYLVKERGLTTMQMGLVGMLPIGAGFLGIQAGGWFSDLLLRRGATPRTARARVPGLSVMVSAPFLVAGVSVESIALCIVCFGLFYFAFSASLAGYWALPLELNPKFVGSIIGVMNTSGNLAGLFGPITAGYLVASAGRWELPFYLAAFLTVISGGIYTLFVKADPIDIETQAAARVQ
jgi:ACS family glucarate transporter-like MFS transporter